MYRPVLISLNDHSAVPVQFNTMTYHSKTKTKQQQKTKMKPKKHLGLSGTNLWDTKKRQILWLFRDEKDVIYNGRKIIMILVFVIMLENKEQHL